MKLICALPNPGTPGFPRGLLYPDTPEGHAKAQQFAREQDRPGWGVFELANNLHEDADYDDFVAVLRANGLNI
jgi:hypothetical protein